MKMPFGKHKGVEIEDLPDDYLRWMINELDEKDPEKLKLVLEAEKEVVFRRTGKLVTTTRKPKPGVT